MTSGKGQVGRVWEVDYKVPFGGSCRCLGRWDRWWLKSGLWDIGGFW